MNELVQLVAQKTGLSEDRAQTAVDTVLSHLKERLPAPIAGQIENALSGGSGGLAGKVSDLLGKKTA